MDDGSIDYYPNSLCFDDKSKLELYGSRYDKDHKYFFVSFDTTCKYK